MNIKKAIKIIEKNDQKVEVEKIIQYRITNSFDEIPVILDEEEVIEYAKQLKEMSKDDKDT